MFFPIPTPSLDLFVFVEVGPLIAQMNLQLVNVTKAGFELLILLPSLPKFGGDEFAVTAPGFSNGKLTRWV